MSPVHGISPFSTNAVLTTPACEIVIDVFTTIGLYTGLRKLRTGWKRTDSLIRRLIRSTVETQLPPLVVCVTPSENARGDA